MSRSTLLALLGAIPGVPTDPLPEGAWLRVLERLMLVVIYLLAAGIGAYLGLDSVLNLP